MKTELISIILPVYNAKKHIRKCIDSIVNQSYKEIELLLIDDGSTDGSEKMCDDYKKADNRIKVFHQKNAGVSAARNKGLDYSTGAYIMFIDSDDYLEAGALDQIVNIIVKDRPDIIKYNYYKQYDGFKIKYQFKCKTNCLISKHNYSKYVYNLFFNSYDFNNVWNAVINRNIIKKIKFDEKLKFAEDKKFMSQAIINSNSLFVSNCYLYNYVINTEGAIRKHKTIEEEKSRLNNILHSLQSIYNMVIDESKEENTSMYKKAYSDTSKDYINNFLNENFSFKNYSDYLMVIKNYIIFDDSLKSLWSLIKNNICSKQYYYYIKSSKIVIRLKRTLKKSTIIIINKLAKR